MQNREPRNTGTLYIVSTPMGNLGDVSLRAIETLKQADMVACEDTRKTRKLTAHYGIHTPLTSYFEHNKFSKGPYLIKLLKEGRDVALVSDSGTPGIQDPGFHVIRLAIEANIPVTAVPGPSALISALVLSGKPTHKFIFEGFLSPKKNTRRRRLAELVSEKRTIIFYESPHRLVKMLEDMREILGDRDIVISRELTKKFEEIRREKISQAIEHFSADQPRGEFVIVV